jgi:hypothetical protein
MASQPIATGQAAEAATSANNAGTSGATTMEFTEGEKVLCYHGPLLYEAKASLNLFKRRFLTGTFLPIVRPN